MPPSPCPNSRLRGSGIIPQRSLGHAAVGLPSCFKSGEYHLPSPGGIAPPPVVYPSLPFRSRARATLPRSFFCSGIVPSSVPPRFLEAIFGFYTARCLHWVRTERAHGFGWRMAFVLARSPSLARSSTVIVLLVFFTLRCNNDSWLRGWLLRPPDGCRLDFAFNRALFRGARSTRDIFFFVATSLLKTCLFSFM